MCNLYSIINRPQAIRELRARMRDKSRRFPDYFDPIVRNAEDDAPELVVARRGMTAPLQFGGQSVTNIRNVASPHWRSWLSARNRCLVPVTSFCEYADTKPRKTPTWFALSEERPLFVQRPAKAVGDEAWAAPLLSAHSNVPTCRPVSFRRQFGRTCSLRLVVSRVTSRIVRPRRQRDDPRLIGCTRQGFEQVRFIDSHALLNVGHGFFFGGERHGRAAPFADRVSLDRDGVAHFRFPLVG
jgi:hypothetical protein